MSDLKFGADELKEGSTYRDKLIEFIRMDMTRDGREHITFKNDNGIDAFAGYVATVEDGCTQRRAVAAVCAIGADILYGFEESDIDKDNHNACRSIIPKIILSKKVMSQVLKPIIIKKSLFVIEGISSRVQIWSDVSGFVYGFADRYHLESSTVFAVVFWLGLDKLIGCDELYSHIKDDDDAVNSIELSKNLTHKINDFNDVILHLNDGGFLF
jgi:hypothetical protein